MIWSFYLRCREVSGSTLGTASRLFSFPFNSRETTCRFCGDRLVPRLAGVTSGRCHVWPRLVTSVRCHVWPCLASVTSGHAWPRLSGVTSGRYHVCPGSRLASTTSGRCHVWPVPRLACALHCGSSCVLQPLHQ